MGRSNKKLVTKKPTTQKWKFPIKDFFNKFNQIHRKKNFVTITKKSLIENFIFVGSDLNNLSVFIYFQYHYYFIYLVDDVRITKKEI